MVVATVYVFAANLYPAPPAITAIGEMIDRQYDMTLWVTGIVFILSQLGLDGPGIAAAVAKTLPRRDDLDA